MWVRHRQQDSVLQAFDTAHLHCIYVYITYIFPSRMVWGLSQSEAWGWPGSGKLLGRVSKGFEQGSKLLVLVSFEKVPGQKYRMNGQWSTPRISNRNIGAALLPRWNCLKTHRKTRFRIRFTSKFEDNTRFREATRKVLREGSNKGSQERKVPNEVAGRFWKVLSKVAYRRNAQWILSPTDCSRC